MVGVARVLDLAELCKARLLQLYLDKRLNITQYALKCITFKTDE